MKRSRIIASAAAAAIAVTALAVFVQGDELVYNSATDPLVSLSYINEVVKTEFDSKLAELTSKADKLSAANDALKTENTALQKQLTDLTVKLGEINDRLTAAEKKSESGYTVICLNKGAKLLADSPCEIILRSGTAIAVSITTNGINDISDGAEIMNAEEIPLYHCLLVPRGGDGRGIQITADEAYIMVRGAYKIVN